MSVFLIIVLLSETGAGSPSHHPGGLSIAAATGCPTTADGVGVSNVLFFFSPMWKLQFSVHVWGAAPDFRGAPVPFVYVVYPQERLIPDVSVVQAELWHDALRPLLKLLSFDFYQAADGCKHNPILILHGVFL